MREKRAYFSILAFVLAMATAYATKVLYPNQGVFAEDNGLCIQFQPGDIIESGCGSSGTYQCHIMVDGEPVTAYKTRINAYDCVTAFWRN